MATRSPEGGNPHNIDPRTLRVAPSEQPAKQPSDASSEAKVVFSSEPALPRSQSGSEPRNIAVPADQEPKKRRREKPTHPAISDPDFKKYQPRKRNQLIQKYVDDIILYILKGGEEERQRRLEEQGWIRKPPKE
jgi:hypothetical protein